MGQCEYISSYGQCKSPALEGRRFCDKHAPNSNATIVGQYHLACKLLEDAPARHSDAKNLKSLVGEIAVLKSLFEKRLNMIDNDAELITAIPTLKDLADRIEKLVSSAHAMDVKLGNLLSKASLVSLAGQMISAIEENIRPFADKLGTETVDIAIEKIGQAIIEAIAAQENKNDRK
jgi:hypothetical protein